jgi:hypothetical protein
VRESLTESLTSDKSSNAKAMTQLGQDLPTYKQARLSAFLSSSAAITDDVDITIRENLLTELVVLGHHPVISGKSMQTWIELCLKARADPHNLVNNRIDTLFSKILAASAVDTKFGFAEASYLAIRTLVFISPAIVLPRVIGQLRTDMNSVLIDNLSALDLGIWSTPEGTTYVDVLSSRKSEDRPKKGKDAEIARWEADLRNSLANKKTAATISLSKQDQALVQAQLTKESVIRERVADIRNNLLRGLQFIHSLVAVNVPEFQPYISTVTSLLLDGALHKGSVLVGEDAVQAYLDLAKCSSERLDSFRIWVGVATLRSMKVDAIPEELEAEPLNCLLTLRLS